MSKRTLISAIALFGLVLSGCEKDQDNDVVGPDQDRQEKQEQPGEIQAGEQPGEMGQAERPGDNLEVLPAVTITGVDVDCTETSVFFPTGSAELAPAEKQVLDSLAACLEGTPAQEKIEITGRADPRGPEPFNQELSQKRAQNVADYLQKQGVKPEGFQIRARGEKGAAEGIPMLWPLQREATVEPKEPVTP